MASELIEHLTQLVERNGDLPVLIGHGHALKTPPKPRVMRAVREEHIKTMFVCHRPLLSDFDTTPVIHLG
jgi:hypothetical protein